MDTYQGRTAEPQTLHKYLYVHGDPINHIDPSGNIGISSFAPTFSVAGTLSTISSAASTFFTRRVVSKLILNVGGIVATTVALNYVLKGQALQDARTELKTKVETAAGGARNRLLFHYTDIVSARAIQACSCIMASSSFSHPDGIFRSSGAYATILQPWLGGNWTQEALKEVLYAKPRGRVVTHFVAFIETPEWRQVVGAEWYRPAPGGFPVPIRFVYRGANVMPLR